MDIKNGALSESPRDIRIEGGVGRKRIRDAEDGEHLKRLRMGPQALGSTLLDAFGVTDQRASLLLTRLSVERFFVIAQALSLSEFARLAVVCKALYRMPWAAEFGREKITEMGCASGGRDILRAVQNDTSMRLDWQLPLFLSFAIKVQRVELFDQSELTGAWIARGNALADSASMVADSDAINDLHTLSWFVTLHPQRRELPSQDANRSVTDNMREQGWLTYEGSRSNASLLSIIDKTWPLYRGTPEYHRLLDKVATDLPSNVSPGRSISQQLAIDLAMHVFQNARVDKVSETLHRCLNVSAPGLATEIDRMIAAQIPGYCYLNRCDLLEECERYRAGDFAFFCMVENAYLGGIEPRAFRGGAYNALLVQYKSPGLKHQMDVRIQRFLDAFETVDGMIYGGDADLKQQVEALCLKISRCDLATFHDLCMDSQRLSYRVAPLLMQRLASKFRHLAGEGAGTTGLSLYKSALFDDFLAWRDRVVQCCVSPTDDVLAARVFAAPLSMWADPPARTYAAHSIYPPLDPGDRAKIAAAATTAFSTLRPHLWQEVLENLREFSGYGECRVLDIGHKKAVMQQFMLDSATTLFRPSAALVDEVLRYVIALWETLPDRAVGAQLQVDVVSDRFGFSAKVKETLRTQLPLWVAQRFVAERCTLHSMLQRYKLLNDVALVDRIENAIWQIARKAALTARGNAYASLASLSQDETLSANLRNRAAIYAAGTTQAVILEGA